MDLDVELVVGVKCPECSEEMMIDFNEGYYESEVVDADREMGAEIEHTYTVEEIQCETCQHEFTAAFTVFEYPEGVHNDDQLIIR